MLLLRHLPLASRWIPLSILFLMACAPPPLEDPPFPGAVRLGTDCFAERRAATPDECREIAAALVEAYGGQERLENLQFHWLLDAYYRRGTMMSNHATHELWIRPDDHYRLHVDFRGGLAQSLVHEGDTYLALRGESILPTRGASGQMVWWEYESLRLPVSLLADDVSLNGKQPEEIEGRWLYPIEVQDRQHPDLILWVDPEGPVIRVVDGVLPLDVAQTFASSLIKRQTYDEFQRIEGVLVPGKMRIQTNEGSDAWETVTLVESVEFRVVESIPLELFDPV